jgi:hypothetical protein
METRVAAFIQTQQPTTVCLEKTGRGESMTSFVTAVSVMAGKCL